MRLIYEAVLGERRFELIDQLVAPDLLDHNAYRRDGLRGPESFRRHADFFHSVLEDCRVSIDEVLIDGDRAVVFWRASGRHQGALWGVEPTGKPVTAETISHFRFRDGLVAEYEARPDRLGLLLQLGALGEFATVFQEATR